MKRQRTARERLVDSLIMIITNRRIMNEERPSYRSEDQQRDMIKMCQQRIDAAHNDIERELIRRYRLGHLLNRADESQSTVSVTAERPPLAIMQSRIKLTP
jgi:hypothetical protein